MPELTLGHFFLFTAALDLVYAVFLGAKLMRADPATPPDRLSALRIVLVAALVTALLLCLLAAFLPQAGMRVA
jgi:hypothetical protein